MRRVGEAVQQTDGNGAHTLEEYLLISSLLPRMTLMQQLMLSLK